MLTVEEVSERLAVSQDAVRRSIRRGDLPAYKVCRRVRVREEDLEQFIEQGRVGGGQVARRRRRPASRREGPRWALSTTQTNP